MKKEIQQALRKQPKTTQPRERIARKVEAAPASAASTGPEAQKPAAQTKGKKE